MVIDKSIARVREYRAARKLSIRTFAIHAGLSPRALARIDDPAWSPTADTLRKLEAAIPSEFDGVAA